MWFTLREEGCKIFENLPALKDSIPVDNKNSLVYIAGHVTRKDDQMSENELLSVITFNHKMYGGYVDSMDRGSLKIPTDSACQWTFFCYTMFQYVSSKICRKSLSDIFTKISEFYNFDMTKEHSYTLSNILLKNFWSLNFETPMTGKEPARKILKLSWL